MVDWDLILRYTRHHSASFANFVGVLYDRASLEKNFRMEKGEW
jgi:hypothetical protein